MSAPLEPGATIDDSDSRFAWQVVAGLRQAITDNIDVTVRYRFFNADNVRTVDFRGFDPIRGSAPLAARRHYLNFGAASRSPCRPATTSR